MKDDTTAYRLNTPTPVLRWRFQSNDDSHVLPSLLMRVSLICKVPLRVNCWPSVGGNGNVIAMIEYELADGFEIVDLTINVPIVYVLIVSLFFTDDVAENLHPSSPLLREVTTSILYLLSSVIFIFLNSENESLFLVGSSRQF